MATPQIGQHTKNVVALLGGKKVLRGRLNDAHGLQQALREGLPFGAFVALQNALELGVTDLADVLGIAARTLARRKSARYLSPIESDRLYRIAYVTLLASEVLGSLEKARLWLQRENRALAGEPPFRLLDTEIGERQVEEVLLRINHGIYS
jgi:putative toxin-antitoxin system antitoxin component (TIGR02293 family)